MNPPVTQVVAPTLLTDAMTVRVLQALAEGLNDREIAGRLHISTRTVQRLVDAFKQVSGTASRFAAGVAACRLGLLPAGELDARRPHDRVAGTTVDAGSPWRHENDLG